VDAAYARRAEFYERTGSPEFYQRQHELALARWELEAAEARAAGRRPSRRPKLVRHPLWSKNHPGNLWNGMLAPLEGYALRGVLWYQGEYNTGTSPETRAEVEPELYAVQLETLIRSWRAAWGRELPFYLVQLAGWLAPPATPVQDHGWAIVREQQARVAAQVPGTGMAVAIDLGDAENIHPPRKREVGERLARIALRRTYGREYVADRGPTLAAARREGGSLRIELHDAEGLRTADGGAPLGFALAGADRVWHAAEARIEGRSVVLASAAVPEPVAARHAWAANPPVNLVNAAGLPAAPFRTDDWPFAVVELPLPAHPGEEDD
jgi:hypothetical protein